MQIFQRARKPLLPTYHEDYKMLVIRSRWAGVEQQFAVIESKELKTQQLATFDKEIQKERNQAKKSLVQLGKQRFYCEKDARKALEKWNKAHPLFLATIDQIETKIVQPVLRIQKLYQK